jgi:hypothetical protein
MSQSRPKERIKVRSYNENYFKGIEPKLVSIRNHEKVMLSGKTGIYIVNVKVEGWGDHTYAFVTVAHSFPQGMIILNSDQVGLVIQRMIEGIDEEL